MASGAFFNPQTALLITPLLSATGSLCFAHDQHFFLRILAQPSVPAETLLPAYFGHFFPPGLARVVSLLGITTWSSVGCIYASRSLLEERGSLNWYVATATLAIGHLIYVPLVAPRIKAILDNGGSKADGVDASKNAKTNVGHLQEWLRYNMIRTLTTDLGAWICAFVAVVKTFSD